MQPRITLISHASTRAMRAATFGSDAPLDEIGRKKAQELAGQIGKADRAWVSPSTQTRETAAILGLAATEDARLRDCDYGRWTGLTFKSVLLREPRKLVSWVRNPASAPHGGETIPEVITRIAGWLNERKRDQGHTVVVSHSAVIRAAIVGVIEADPKSFWRIDIEPLARADLRTNGRRWVLRALHPGRTINAGQ